MALSRAFLLRRTALQKLSTVAALWSLCCAVSFSQTTSSDLRNGYFKAMEAKQANARTLALEDWLQRASTDPLRRDAMQVIVWDYKRIGNHPDASNWAQKLLDVDQDNALALSVLADSARYHEGSSVDQNMANSLSLARRGLRRISYLHRPEAMSDAEFADLQRMTETLLNGAAGFAYVHQLDFVTARNYLRRAATLQPDNPQYVYELALADLMGKQQQPEEGFLYLAKAVNLTQGTPAGQQIAAFAAARYQRDGGTAQNWDQYLVATAPAGRAPATVASAATPTTPSAAAATTSTTTAPTTPNPTVATNQIPKQQLPQTSAPQPKPSEQAERPGEKHITEEQIAATLVPPPLPPAQTKPKPIAHPGAPISLGILLEASVNSRENRRAVTSALTDLVRYLTGGDEAFILSFSHDLVFEQDLTQNYDYLRQAVESVKPQSGTALLDAVTFASGHLDRVSRKGSQRVLLVVSDGRDISSHSSPYDVTGAIDASGVKIYCIGLDIGDSADRSRLEALAQRSGGRASFTRSGNFRGAVQDVARNLGLYFPQQQASQ